MRLYVLCNLGNSTKASYMLKLVKSNKPLLENYTLKAKQSPNIESTAAYRSADNMTNGWSFSLEISSNM